MCTAIMFDFILQWSATILILIHIYLYGKKSLYGPILGIVSSVLWVLIGYRAGIIPLVVTNVVCLGIHFNNMIKWKLESINK
jgi:hypothetical protein